jgi:hypothetical protein
MSGTVEIEFSISTPKRGSEVRKTIQFDKDDWDALTPEEKEEEIRSQAFGLIRWSYSETIKR